MDKVTKKLREIENQSLGDPRSLEKEEIFALIKIARAVVAMRKEALAYETWYTFVPCDHGEDVDEALKELGDL